MLLLAVIDHGNGIFTCDMWVGFFSFILYLIVVFFFVYFFPILFVSFSGWSFGIGRSFVSFYYCHCYCCCWKFECCWINEQQQQKQIQQFSVCFKNEQTCDTNVRTKNIHKPTRILVDIYPYLHTVCTYKRTAMI